MGNFRIKVFEADGRYRGGFYRDNPAADHRWIGRTSQSEVMVCEGDPATGHWLLLEYRLPRQIDPESGDDNPIDVGSRCCQRTVPQALLWFTSQDFGPPPVLVERARRFSADWLEFRSSAPAIALLEQISHNQFTPCDHPAFQGDGRKMIELFERLDLLGLSGGAPSRLFVVSIVTVVGVRQFIDWMDRHLDAVADITKAQPFESRPTGMDVPSPGSPKDWLSLMEHVERAYDLLGHYLRALQPSDGLPKHEIDSANWRIEVVLRRWLPLAFQAEDQVIRHAHGLIGMRADAIQFLDQADLGDGRSSCLKSLADRAYAEAKNAEDSLAACLLHLELWREMLPAKWVDGTGPIQLSAWDRLSTSASTFYWSADLAKRRSLRGASYLLAVGCDALANEAVRIGLPSERARPALRLAIRLREHPEFPHVDDQVLHAVVHEQIVLAREVEEIIAEVGLTIRARQKAHPQSGEIRVSFADAVEGRPDLLLPPTPKSTLQRWIRNPEAASDLGANPEGKFVAQTLKVEALLRMQSLRPKRRPVPQPKAPGKPE